MFTQYSRADYNLLYFPAFVTNRYFEFPDGKHNIHLRYADQFNEAVQKFLQSE